jgi:uncharacterized phiE125 gp8 family phage protein
MAIEMQDIGQQGGVSGLLSASDTILFTEIQPYLRINEGDSVEEAVVMRLKNAVVEAIAKQTGRVFGHRQYEIHYDKYSRVQSDGWRHIPHAPVTSIDSVEVNGTALTYERKTENGITKLTFSASSADDVVVKYTVGDEPDDLRQAVFLWVGNWYEHRESTIVASINEVPHGLDRILEPYRIYSMIG